MVQVNPGLPSHRGTPAGPPLARIVVSSSYLENCPNRVALQPARMTFLLPKRRPLEFGKPEIAAVTKPPDPRCHE